jgi:uncharacterized integral membrane protein
MWEAPLRLFLFVLQITGCLMLLLFGIGAALCAETRTATCLLAAILGAILMLGALVAERIDELTKTLRSSQRKEP